MPLNLKAEIPIIKDVDDLLVSMRSEITQTAEAITLKVSKNELVSSINQTAETIKINASKIDLQGYVTISSLSNVGTTTIDGSNIKTGTIKAVTLMSTNYSHTSGVFSNVGTAIYLNNGIIRTPNFGINAAGNAYFRGAIEATSLTISSIIANNAGIATTSQIPTHTSQLNNNSGYQNATGVTTITKGVVTTDYVNALGVTASRVTVAGKFDASANDSYVYIGGWYVGEGGIYRTDGTWGAQGGMYFGDSGLSISNVFKVNSAGALTCTGANVTGTFTMTGGSVNITTSTANYSFITLNHSNNSLTLSPSMIRFKLSSGYCFLDSEGFYAGYTGAGSFSAAIERIDSYVYNLNVKSTLAVQSTLNVYGACTLWSGLNTYGTKNRVVRTDHYGEVLMNAYETPQPLFAEVGHATIYDDGLCYVYLDATFYETVDYTHEHRHFLTKYGPGDLWIDKDLSTKDYFVVRGTPGLDFDWKVEAVQKDYNGYNMEHIYAELEKENDNYGHCIEDAAAYLYEYERGLLQ